MEPTALIDPSHVHGGWQQAAPSQNQEAIAPSGLAVRPSSTVQRIHFTVEDLAQTHIITGLGWVPETLLALCMLSRGDVRAAYGGWQRRVHRRLGPRVHQFASVGRDVRPESVLLSCITHGDGHDTASVGSELAGVVQEFFAIAVAPHWRRICNRLAADRDARGRVVLAGGLASLLATLHERARWAHPVLELPAERGEDVFLDGRGLRIAPSLFLADTVPVLIKPAEPGPVPTLVYPVPMDRQSTGTLWNLEDPNDRALGALVGRTRAALLRALADACSTGELSRRLGISSAAVSQHTSVLRYAGLITTTRHQNTVRHTLTSLGTTLLHCHDTCGAG